MVAAIVPLQSLTAIVITDIYLAAMAEDTDKTEILRSAMDSAREMIKACLLINSGAAVALLAFTGQLLTKDTYHALITELLPSLNWFVAGIVGAILAHGMSYTTNLLFWRGYVQGQTCRIIAGVLTLVSVGSFIIGCYSVSRSFSRMSPSTTKPTTIIQGAK